MLTRIVWLRGPAIAAAIGSVPTQPARAGLASPRRSDYSHAMRRALLLAPLLVVGCKKDQPSGLPPADNWKNPQSGETSAAQQPSTAPTAPANPHGGGMGADPSNPHGGAMGADPSNPHAGMGTDPSNPHAGMGMPGSSSPKTLDTLPDGRSGMGPFSLDVPKEWAAKPVTSSMRAADWVISAKPGEETELIVYYFGTEGAGSVEANLDRWAAQFQSPSNKKIDKTKLAGQDATVMTVSGHYNAEAMPGGGGTIDIPEGAMIAAIVSSPQGPYYFRMVGAKKTVDANAPKLQKMLSSMKVR